MVKHISLVHRPAGMSHDEFVDYWKNVHAKLVKACLPGLRRYVGNIACEGGAMPGSGKTLECDAVVELHFDDAAALRRAFASPEWQSERRKASSLKMADLARHQFIVAEEIVIPLEEGK